MPEQEKFSPTPEQTIEGKFGKEALERVKSSSECIQEAIRDGLVNIGNQEGSSQQQQQEAEKYLQMWQDFANMLFARTTSANAASPELVETALKGAHALLAIEASGEFSEPAKKMVAALDKRY